MPDLDAGPEAPRFEAIITPHRSLGPVGLRNLIAFLLILSAIISTGLWFAGAWPVIGFNGAEITLAIVLLRRNAKERRSVERLVLDDAGFVILRTDQKGRSWRRRLDTAWLNAVLEERPGRSPLLLLVNRGHRHEVGADLGEDEKRDLARALRSAFHRERHPIFDNPQLRPE